MTYSDQGRFDEAEELKLEVLEMSKRVLGCEHPDTVTRKSNLAITYWHQARSVEAAILELEALASNQCVLGDEHPSTMTCQANLAYTMKTLGEEALALCMMTQSAKASTQILRSVHMWGKSR